MVWGRGFEPRFSDPKSEGLPLAEPQTSGLRDGSRTRIPGITTPCLHRLGYAQTWSAVQDLNLPSLICSQTPQPLGQRRKTKFWSVRLDLNQRSPAPKAGGFAGLSYTPKILERNKGVEPFFRGWRPRVQPLYQFRVETFSPFTH